MFSGMHALISIFLILGALAFLPMMFDTSSGPDDEVEGDADDGGGTDGPGELMGETLIGSDDSDTLSGSSGDDLIYGNDGNDLAECGDIYPVDNETRDDTIYGGSGTDTVIGGFGYDQLYGGGDGDGDTVHGWNGADTLYGGEGNDTSYGGASDDNIFDVQQTYDSVPNISLMDGGAGNDSLSFDAGSTIADGTGDDRDRRRRGR